MEPQFDECYQIQRRIELLEEQRKDLLDQVAENQTILKVLVTDISEIKSHVESFSWFSDTVNKWRNNLFWSTVKVAFYVIAFFLLVNCEQLKSWLKNIKIQ